MAWARIPTDFSMQVSCFDFGSNKAKRRSLGKHCSQLATKTGGRRVHASLPPFTHALSSFNPIPVTPLATPAATIQSILRAAALIPSISGRIFDTQCPFRILAPRPRSEGQASAQTVGRGYPGALPDEYRHELLAERRADLIAGRDPALERDRDARRGLSPQPLPKLQTPPLTLMRHPRHHFVISLGEIACERQ